MAKSIRLQPILSNKVLLLLLTLWGYPFSARTATTGQADLVGARKYLNHFDFNCSGYLLTLAEDSGKLKADVKVSFDSQVRQQGKGSLRCDYAFKSAGSAPGSFALRKIWGNFRSDLSFHPAGLSLWVKGSPGCTDLLKITLLQQNEEFTLKNDRLLHFYVTNETILGSGEWQQLLISYDSLKPLNPGSQSGLNLARVAGYQFEIVNKSGLEHSSTVHFDAFEQLTSYTPEVAEPAKFSSIFIQLHAEVNQNTDWETTMRAYREVYIDTMIIQHATRHKESEGVFHYSGSQLQWMKKEYDMIDRMFVAAEKTGMKLILGLNGGKYPENKGNALTYDTLYYRNREVLDELYDRFSGSPSMAGWYICEEFHDGGYRGWWKPEDRMLLAGYQQRVAAYAKSKPRKFIVTIAPALWRGRPADMTYEFFRSFFAQTPDIDILYLQDCGGRCYVDDGDYDVDLPNWYAMIKKACDENGVRFGVDIESFERCACEGIGFRSKSWEPLKDQLLYAGLYTRNITQFSWTTFRPGRGAFEEYRRYVQEISGNSRIVSPDTLKRRAELERIIKLLPADNLANGRVSFLDKTFKDWLVRTGELPPDFDQMPSIPFLPDPLILDEGVKNIPVTTPVQWQEKRNWMKEQLAFYISGSCPPAPGNLTSKVISEEKDGEVLVREVELSFGPGHRAKLTLQLMIPPGKGPFPVFLTNWNHREWAMIAVRRGYIGCLYAGADTKDDTEAWSEIWAGQYDFTRLMRRAYGASRAVDYLWTLPVVDKAKIGITGHSRNGKTSLMAAAFDERIGACIPSSGGTGAEVPWRYNAHKYDVEDIALLACAQPAWLHPRLRFFIGREHKLPVDQNHFMALVAPRGLMLSTAHTESASNLWGIEQVYHASKKVYRFLGAEEHVAIATRYGLHGVSARDIEGYVDFFDYVFDRNTIKPPDNLKCSYSFEDWCRLTREQINPLDYPVKKASDLVTEPDRGIVRSTAEWQTRKAGIQEQIRWGLGKEPAGVTNKGPGTLRNGGNGENKTGTFLNRPDTTGRMKVMMITPYSGFGENLFGYLYFPSSRRGAAPEKPVPVVVYLHEYDYSKGFSAMGFDHEINSLFRTLTGMGYAVFSYDMIGFGNRLEEATHFYQRYPGWSKMGKMVADVDAAVDALENIDFIDGSRIYVTGYSLGGTVGLLSAALDDRIAGVVSVAGFSPMRSGGEENGREGIKAFSHLHGLMPRLGFFTGNTNRLPFDFEEVMACIAPRPLLVIAPLYDKDASLADIREAVGETRKVYGIFNAANRISLFVPDDYNRFSPVMRTELYRWLKTESNGN